MNNKHITLICIIVFLIAFFVFAMKGRRDIKKNTVFSHAVIREIKLRYKDPGIVFSYTFICNGQKHENTSLLDCNILKLQMLRDSFLNKEFPMVYDSEHCYNNNLLFDIKSVREYNAGGSMTQYDNKIISTMASIQND